MRVDWATTCRYAGVNAGLATIVGAGIDTYWPSAFPAEVTGTILARVVGRPEETEQMHTLVVRVLGPDMTPSADPLEAQFQTDLSPAHYPGWEQQVLLPIGFRFRASEAGIFTIEIGEVVKTCGSGLLVTRRPRS
ncbi:MAG: hypothetical protein WD271_03150, partial [Acidimicrobiia bacterium]